MTVSKAVLLLWIFYVSTVLCLLCLCARLFICALWSPAGKGLTSWLSVVVSNCEFVILSLVSCVRCCTWLYRFLIFAPLLTFIVEQSVLKMTKLWDSAYGLTHLLRYATNTFCTDVYPWFNLLLRLIQIKSGVNVLIWNKMYHFKLCCWNRLSDPKGPEIVS